MSGEFVITDTALIELVQLYIFPFVRISALFMLMPIISARTVPQRIRLLMALLATYLIVPLIEPYSVSDDLSLLWFVIIGKEVLVGALIAFAYQVVFQVFVLGGQIIAMKMGLGFASMNDPTNGVQTTIISQFYLVFVTLLFTIMNGHIYLIKFVATTFNTLPVNFSIPHEILFNIAEMGSWMFASALSLALPVITGLLFINIAFGVMSRASPQLNIFAVGFPFTLIAGLFIIWLGMKPLANSIDETFGQGFLFLDALFANY